MRQFTDVILIYTAMLCIMIMITSMIIYLNTGIESMYCLFWFASAMLACCTIVFWL